MLDDMVVVIVPNVLYVPNVRYVPYIGIMYLICQIIKYRN